MRAAWSTGNHDFSSSVTGSTVFDFEGDGIAEVIYNDECYMWVYDGPTGNVRFAAPTNSFTGTEASLVVDIDGNPVCRFAGGRTCSRGPRAGQTCSADGECCASEMECVEPEGSCARPGPDGLAFVCPG